MEQRNEIDTLHVSKADIPDYLQASAFLHTWDDTEELVAIHASVLKKDTLILSLVDLDHLLRTLRFWIVCDIPSSVFDFVMGGREGLCKDTLLEYSNDLAGIAILLKIINVPQPNRWSAALQLDCLNCVQFMLEHVILDASFDCCLVAAAAGAVNCLVYLQEKGFPWSVDMFIASIQNGHTHCAQYLYEKGCPCSADVCDIAAAFGQLECLKYLHEIDCAWSATTCSLAAANNCIECLQYLHENCCEWDSCTCEMSAANGHSACLFYAMENGCICTQEALKRAAENGHVHILREFFYKDNNDSPLVQSVVQSAARQGQLECLKFLFSIGCDLSNNAPMYAAWLGHLHCLRFCYKQGVAWEGSTTTLAAGGGHMDCFVYAVERGCPYSHGAFILASTPEMKSYVASLLGIDVES